MKETIRLGRFRGIELGAHWSVLVIGWLLAWALADGQFPSDAPGSDPVLYWLAAVVAVVIFWGALLAHELAHSLVATRHGVEVDGITLWLFGGVSRLRGEARTPADELRIALAGPATSVTIAAIFGAFAGSAAALGAPELLVAMSTWLAVINAMLAGFNLVPAAPLDGGRVLHALVWRRSGDRSTATMTATNAGRWFAYALIGLGVVLVSIGNLGGFWFAFLGWFLLNAARAEAGHALLQEAITGMRVRDVMTPEPFTASADATIDRLLEDQFLRHHCSAFPLLDHLGRVRSLITLRQVKSVLPDRRSVLQGFEVGWPVDEVPHASPGEPVIDLLERLAGAEGGDGRALVFDDDQLVGIVSPTDISHALELAVLRRDQPAGARTSMHP